MSFFKSLYKSTHDLSWLKEQNKSAKKAWGYFALFVLVMVVVWLIPVFIMFPGAIKNIKQFVEKEVPNFQAEFKDGRLSVTELEQPFVKTAKDFVFVVDTISTNTPALEMYLDEKIRSGAIFSKNGIEMYDDEKGQGRMQSWKDFPDTQFTKKDMMDFTNKYSSSKIIVPVILLIIIPFLYGFLFISKLISILIVSLVVRIISGLAKRGWTFGQLFVTSLFAVTLPSFISLVFGWIGVQIPLLHSLALFAFLLAVVFTDSQAALTPEDNQKT